MLSSTHSPTYSPASKSRGLHHFVCPPCMWEGWRRGPRPLWHPQHWGPASCGPLCLEQERLRGRTTPKAACSKPPSVRLWDSEGDPGRSQCYCSAPICECGDSQADEGLRWDEFVCVLGSGGKLNEWVHWSSQVFEAFWGRKEESEQRRCALGSVGFCVEQKETECDCTGWVAPDWRSWLGDGSPRTPTERTNSWIKCFRSSVLQLYLCTLLRFYLDEQGLRGHLYGFLRGLQLSLELGSLNRGLI